MSILVTGGGGYIGSFMVKNLLDRGEEVSVLDNFSHGYRDAIDQRATVYEGDILDLIFIRDVFTQQKFDAVIHFAGLISVPESTEKPGEYFRTNVQGTINLLEYIRDSDTKFIFSSTAAVYGDPKEIPIPENHSKNPSNPYGESKLMVEKILEWYNKIYSVAYASLRYFNASGAAIDGSMGERHSPETHIIPNAINAAIQGSEFKLFGTDFETEDGTCIRDYIHVLDLVKAHLLVLDKLSSGEQMIYNVGTGKGLSNKEIIKAVERVSGKNIKVKEEPRRVGDPAELVADSSKISKELKFTPSNSDVETIVASAWKWHSKK